MLSTIRIVAIVASVTIVGVISVNAMQERDAETDHSMFITEPFDDAHAVTATCLICHPDTAEAFMGTSHWTWVNGEVLLPGSEEVVPFGKLNSLNNFCISVPGNWSRCSQCHAGYGWVDEGFDFSNPENIDCLICHDRTGTYKKAKLGGGYPEDGVDLLAVAQSVGPPVRANCGSCHFQGGGGDNVKHGDLDRTMIDCDPELDVHMGKLDFACQACHVTDSHDISGRLPWLGTSKEQGISCEGCHGEEPHELAMVNRHLRAVACQTCHVPSFALSTPTKVFWDWSSAGLAEAPDERPWSKPHGSYEFASDVVPDYTWWNGDYSAHLPGEQIADGGETVLNQPLGSLEDTAAKIWPFKVHRAKQPYDTQLNHLLIPRLVGEDGFWQTFDWNQANALGAESSGVAYSGDYGFALTAMYWPITHMVQPKESALGCMDCHGERGRMPFAELGYDGDPMITGAR